MCVQSDFCFQHMSSERPQRLAAVPGCACVLGLGRGAAPSAAARRPGALTGALTAAPGTAALPGERRRAGRLAGTAPAPSCGFYSDCVTYAQDGGFQLAV